MTREEIEKAIECCNPYSENCTACPFRNLPRGRCFEKLARTAFNMLVEDKAKLQKQVDELKEERENMQAEIIATEEIRLQTEKETAKSILIEIIEWIKGQYDSKLDTYSIHIPFHELNDFYMNKAKEYGLLEDNNER